MGSTKKTKNQGETSENLINRNLQLFRRRWSRFPEIKKWGGKNLGGEAFYKQHPIVDDGNRRWGETKKARQILILGKRERN